MAYGRKMCAERRKRYSKVRTDREIVKREKIYFARRKIIVKWKKEIVQGGRNML